MMNPMSPWGKIAMMMVFGLPGIVIGFDFFRLIRKREFKCNGRAYEMSRENACVLVVWLVYRIGVMALVAILIYHVALLPKPVTG